MKKNKIFLGACFFFFLLTIFSGSIHFFWDGTFFSALALEFYENGFNGFIAPASADTGGFPMYPVYLALCWKLFSKTLLVSHLVFFPFLCGIAWEYFKLAKRYTDDTGVFVAFIFLALQPVFITQSMLMGYDVIIAYFFLLSLNAMLNDRRILFGVGLLLLCMISIRGIMLGVSLGIVDLLLNKNRKNFLAYLSIGGFLICWSIYHHSQTGWYMFSPERENNAEKLSDIRMMFRQAIYILWKNLDLGNIILWLTVLSGLIILKKQKIASRVPELFRITLAAVLTLTCFMILIRNPIGHKYFLVIFILLGIGAACIVRMLENAKARILLYLSICAAFITGNFIMYPQRYGNGWDVSLKIYPYFKLKAEMDAYITEQGLNQNFVFTQFPLTADHRSTELAEYSRCYADIEDLAVDDIEFFLYSNIINTNRMEDLDYIKRNWIVEKKLESGQVSLILYRNPGGISDPIAARSSTDQGKAGTPSPGMAKP